jgi:hypothetical protein
MTDESFRQSYMGLDTDAIYIDRAKRAFYKASNAIFSKLLLSAYEITIVHLLRVKCLTILLYGLEASDFNIGLSLQH